MPGQAIGCFQRLRLTPSRRVFSLFTNALWRPRRSPTQLSASLACLTSLPRWCHGRSTPSVSSASTPAAEESSIRDRFVCPECGKRLLCAANLRLHRTTRHGVRVVTPQEEAKAALITQNITLQHELSRLRARVKRLKEEKTSNKVSSSSSAVVSKSYPSAVLTGQLMDVDATLAQEWRRTGYALGTGISFIECVGTVSGPVQLGALAGAASASAGAAPRVLQFTLEAHGYRERRPGELKMYRAQMLVRYIPSQAYHEGREDSAAAAAAAPSLFAVQEGDVVRVQGHYALHNTYDMVSKLPVENVVVEADMVGMLRQRQHSAGQSAAAMAATVTDTASHGISTTSAAAMTRPAPSSTAAPRDDRAETPRHARKSGKRSRVKK